LDNQGRETAMAGRADKSKGRIKEAMGALTENRWLKERGRDDRAKGSLKKHFGKARRKLR
jgi:uncharacterized protein YjbJ (UPF0337 family)